jgi:FkbM family methyltransferase
VSPARSFLARLARGLVNRVVGDRLRTVRVLSGAASGCRMELDLSKEKAYWLGRYEPATQRFFRASIDESDVVYDVGAHIGFFSLCACRRGAHVVAVEPDPENAARLRTNVALNGFDVDVVEAAAWRETGRVALVFGGSTKELTVAPGDAVESITLDELSERYRPPTVVKLDVEGAEGAALEGAARVLTDHLTSVVCEIHGAEQRAAVLAALSGYAVEELGDDRIVARRTNAR